jgi:hypothetical protein
MKPARGVARSTRSLTPLAGPLLARSLGRSSMPLCY